MTASTAEYRQLLIRARSLAPDLRLTLAEELLRTLHSDFLSAEPRGVPSERVRGLAAGSGSPPDDDTLRRWVEEHRQEKYE